MTEEEYTEEICIREVNENLRRIRLGGELTRPLKQLLNNCDFKAKYNEAFDIWEADNIQKEKKIEYKIKYEKHKDAQREYRKRPDIKEKMKKLRVIYAQKPEIKEKLKKYKLLPEVKTRAKKHRELSDVKQRKREYDKKRNLKLKDKQRKQNKL